MHLLKHSNIDNISSFSAGHYCKQDDVSWFRFQAELGVILLNLLDIRLQFLYLVVMWRDEIYRLLCLNIRLSGG